MFMKSGLWLVIAACVGASEYYDDKGGKTDYDDVIYQNDNANDELSVKDWIYERARASDDGGSKDLDLRDGFWPYYRADKRGWLSWLNTRSVGSDGAKKQEKTAVKKKPKYRIVRVRQPLKPCLLKVCPMRFYSLYEKQKIS